MVATKRSLLKIYLLPEEKAEIFEQARRISLSCSELGRRRVTYQKVPDINLHQNIVALAKINGDQARLGNLLRMALADVDFKPPAGTNLDAIFDDIRKTQTLLKKKIRELDILP